MADLNPLCACGCGEQVLWPTSRYRRGHWAQEQARKVLPGDKVRAILEATRPDGECLVWDGPLKDTGYADVTYLGRTTSAHRLLFILLNPDLDCSGQDVHHVCENRACLRPGHLELRPLDKHRQGHMKLTQKDVDYIRSTSKSGYRLAKELGVAESTISRIRNNKHWKNNG